MTSICLLYTSRQYDKDGNLKDWWTAEDAKNFYERAQVMVNFFDSIEVAPGVYANGRMTFGENIADHGGLQVSYQAFKKATAANPLPVLDGLTPDQRFFLAYAGAVSYTHLEVDAIAIFHKKTFHIFANVRTAFG